MNNVNGNIDNKIAIQISNASLNIPVYAYSDISLKTNIIEIFKKFSGRLKASNDRSVSIKALQNINLNIYKGDRVALIGSNGAGKTTFLKLISGIYTSTTGYIKRNVDVFPLIQRSFLTSEELSGYEATKAHYLLHGDQRIMFDDYIKEIISFSGLEDFIYLPINTYSAGMKTRLMFSLLTSFDFECLALDEGIGTGDSEFIKKANERLNKFIANAGTLILASHSESLLKEFCNKGIVIKKGIILFKGNLEESLEFYKNSYDE